MRLSPQQIAAIESAIWLFGLAALFATGYWWPGIMFVIGASSLIGGLIKGLGWAAVQGAVWSIGIGVWAMFDFRVEIMLVLLGLSALAGAFVRPPAFAKPKPAPDYDRSWD